MTRPSQRGQATVEYVLIMLIVIAMISGAVYQLNDAFRFWMNNYFGNYLTCLLETGELPITGGKGDSGGGKNQASLCVEEYQKFDIKNGKTTNGSAGSGGQSGQQGGSGSRAARNADGGGGSRLQSDSSGGSSSANSRAVAEAAARAEAQRKAALANKSAYTGSTEISSGALVRGPGSGEGGPGGTMYGDRSFLVQGKRSSASGSEKKKEARIQVDSTPSLRQPTFVKKRRLASSQAEEPDEPMTFGDYFRYILIAAVVIILVIVIGSQLARLRQELE